MAQVTHVRSKADSPTKTCHCGRPMRARGLCSTHYNQRSPNTIVIAQCAACGSDVAKHKSNVDRGRVVCSYACRAYLQNGPAVCHVPISHSSRVTSCLVPESHPSREPRSCPVPTNHPSRRRRMPRFHAALCRECGTGFVVDSEYVGSPLHYCSMSCQRRTAKRARRAREAGASGSFTWDDFAKLTIRLGSMCAYCEGDNNGQQFEPDHVVPISRHGHNGLANILPSCRRCNGDKRDLLVDEWSADRVRRGLPSLRYDVDRFVHLTAHRYADAA